MIRKSDFMLLLGIGIFLILIRLEGIEWAIEQFLIIMVSITLFEWVRQRLNSLKSEK